MQRRTAETYLIYPTLWQGGAWTFATVCTLPCLSAYLPSSSDICHCDDYHVETARGTPVVSSLELSCRDNC